MNSILTIYHIQAVRSLLVSVCIIQKNIVLRQTTIKERSNMELVYGKNQFNRPFLTN